MSAMLPVCTKFLAGLPNQPIVKLEHRQCDQYVTEIGTLFRIKMESMFSGHPHSTTHWKLGLNDQDSMFRT